MAQDISNFINRKWPKDMASIVRLVNEWDARLKGHLDDRRLRSALFLADGSIDDFVHYIELSFTDYRDLFWQAEYACTEERGYDFTKTFPENGIK